MSADDEVLREATALTSELSNGLVTLERSPDEAAVAELFRAAHSLKGVCDMGGLDGAATLAHAIEDFLSAVRAADVAPAGWLVDGALDAVDEIQAILNAVETGATPAASPDSTAAELRDLIEEQRKSENGIASPDTGATEPSDAGVEVPEPDGDLSAEEALDRASVFDDLDSLAAEMDDDGFPELEGAGSFDDIEWDEAPSPASDGATAPSTEKRGPEPDVGEPAPEAGPDETPDDRFSSVKEETPEESDIDTLDTEISEESFGQFDDEDDVSIRELVEMEPDVDPDAEPDIETETQTETETETETVQETETQTETQTESAQETETETAQETASGTEGADPAGNTETVETSAIDAVEDSFPEAGTDAAADDPFIWVGDEMAEETDIDSLDAEIAEESFGEFDDEDDVSIRDLVEMEPDEETDDAEGGGDDAVETATADAAEDASSDAGADTAADRPVFWVRDRTPEATDIDSLDAEIAEESFGEFDDEDDVTIRELVQMNPDIESDASRTAGASPAPDTSAPTEPAQTMDEDTEGEDAESEDAESEDAESEDTHSPAEIDDIAIDFSEEATGAPSTGEDEGPDEDVLDVIEGVDLDHPDPTTATPDVEFEREAGIEAFTDQFGELFDIDSDAEATTLSAGTIEESTLDADRFRRETSVTTESTGTSIHSISVDVATSDDLLNLVEELSMTRLSFEDSLGDGAPDDAEDALGALQSIEAEFRRAVTELRLMPLSPAVDGLPRVARDIARDQGKRLSVDVEGDDVRLDRSVVERVGEPLVHLVRNAADHGIEPPEEREAAGKPPEGHIELRAEQVRDGAVIEVEDDGRGIDADAVLAKAVEDGVVTRSEAETMDDEDVYELLFHHGLSTSEEVTDVSGRGVGMDIVSRICADLDGSVEVESEPGAGTTVRLRLPVTVAMATLLFVEVGGERYAIPTADIEYVGSYGVDSTVNDGAFVPNPAPDREYATSDVDDDGDDQYRLLRLHQAFDVPTPPTDDGVLVWLRPENGQIALYCDDVVESREAVVKPYGPPLDHVPGISGATMQEDGDVINIIDVTTIA